MARIVTFLVHCCLAAALPAPTHDEIEVMWARFQKENSRQYGSEPRRYVAFKKNVLLAHALNEEQGVTCTDMFDDEQCVFGITKFSDMFEDEFEATHMGYKPSHSNLSAPVLSSSELKEAPTTVDWRKKGAVTAVKDQGDCGSCWAFSTTEEIESAVFMNTGKLETLSTQQIISCDKQDDGCNGGDTVTAYKYIEQAGGLDSSADYPDKSHTSGRTGKCKWDKKTSAKVTGFTYATKPCNSGACKNQDEDALAAALATKGPISICVNAGGNGWQVYKRGVYSKKCSGASEDLDHCVQLVGYDKSGTTPYWIVRNSWNTDWGIDGYMHLEMGKNLCGVADEATIAQATSATGMLTV
jgi:C1A family cysteine protease